MCVCARPCKMTEGEMSAEDVGADCTFPGPVLGACAVARFPAPSVDSRLHVAVWSLPAPLDLEVLLG